MNAFRVEPSELTELARELVQTEPFAALAESARNVPLPTGTSATAMAIQGFRYRLSQELDGFGAATRSLGRATRSAAVSYSEVEIAIGRRIGGRTATP